MCLVATRRIGSNEALMLVYGKPRPVTSHVTVSGLDVEFDGATVERDSRRFSGAAAILYGPLTARDQRPVLKTAYAALPGTDCSIEAEAEGAALAIQLLLTADNRAEPTSIADDNPTSSASVLELGRLPPQVFTTFLTATEAR